MEAVERWKGNIGESSWVTYRSWWKRFEEFLDSKNLTVAHLTDMISRMSVQEATDLVTGFWNWLKEKGYSRNSCACAFAAVRSFFAYNGLRLGKVGNKFNGKTQYEEGKEFIQKEIYQLIDAVQNVRDKGAAGLCFQGGQREGIACSLKVKHILTRNWESARVVVFKVPEYLPDRHGKNVNKREVKYKFAVLDDVARYVVMHLREREAAGEKITPESWLFRSHKVGRGAHTGFSDSRVFPIYGEYLNTAVKRAAERLGLQSSVKTSMGKNKFSVHAHVGRLYYKTQMRLGGVDVELRDFMMGHIQPFGGAYDKYSEQEIVAAMEKARQFLALTPEPANELELKKRMALGVLKELVPAEHHRELEQLVMNAQSTEELDNAVNYYRDVRQRLEVMKR